MLFKFLFKPLVPAINREEMSRYFSSRCRDLKSIIVDYISKRSSQNWKVTTNNDFILVELIGFKNIKDNKVHLLGDEVIISGEDFELDLNDCQAKTRGHERKALIIPDLYIEDYINKQWLRIIRKMFKRIRKIEHGKKDNNLDLFLITKHENMTIISYVPKMEKIEVLEDVLTFEANAISSVYDKYKINGYIKNVNGKRKISINFSELIDLTSLETGAPIQRYKRGITYETGYVIKGWRFMSDMDDDELLELIYEVIRS